MRLAIAAEPGEARVGEPRLAARDGIRQGQRRRAPPDHSLTEIEQRRPAGPRRGGREAPGEDIGREVDGVDERPADVARDRADPHPGERLAKTRRERIDHVLDGLGGRDRLGAARPGQLGGKLEREPRVDGCRPDRKRHRHRVDVEDVGRVEDEIGPAAEARVGEGGVDRTRRQDRRHRETIRRERRVAHDEDFDTGLTRRNGGERESFERESEPAGALRDRPRRIENAVTSTTARESLDQPAEIRDDRPFEPERPWTTRRAAEKRRSATQLDPEIHDDSLALGVDRRVRHLRERLPQVVGGGPVQPSTTRRGRVVAHAPERLVRLEGHRLDVEPRLLGVETGEVAESMIQSRPCLDRRGCRLGRVLVERPRGIVDREVAEDARLRIGVLEDRAPTRFDQQHLARSEATATDGLRGGERHGARFRCDSHHPIRRDREGRRAKPVPVDERADALSIGEHDGGRAVPRREHACGPATQCRHVRVRCPAQTHGLGDRRQQRRGEIPPGRRQQLEALVERQRVGAVRRQQRSGVEQLGRDRSPPAVARSPADLLAVAADRVDLAVVGDRPERLSEPPDGRGVRCVPLVEDRVRDFDRRPQVRVQLAQSRPRDQALVDDGPARCRWHRQPGDRTACRSRGCLQTPPSDDQPTFERRVRRADRPRDDRLDHGRTRRRGSRPERPRLERNGSPANDRQAGIREHPLAPAPAPPAPRPALAAGTA